MSCTGLFKSETTLLGSVTVFEDKSKVEFSLASVIVPGAISAATIVPSSILSASIELSEIPVFVTFCKCHMFNLSLYL